MLIISSSGISWPLSIYCLAVLPSSVSFLISLRSTSPVEIWPNPYFLIIKSLCVPFPEPGAPKITIFFIFKLDMVCLVLLLFNQSIYVAQVAALLVVVKSVAYDKVIGNFHRRVFNVQVDFQFFRLQQQCANVYGGRVACPQ